MQITDIMETNIKSLGKINVRGAISALEVGEFLELPNTKIFNNEGYKVSSVRNTASSITGDTGRKFNVSTTDELITITRIF